MQIREIERARYGRTVAELYLGKQSVNLQMVKQGQAVVYRQYLTGCASTKNQYLQAEAQAKQKSWDSGISPSQSCRGILGKGNHPAINHLLAPSPSQPHLPNKTVIQLIQAYVFPLAHRI
ncbi:thermonuclease family protein [Trichocoleus sp. ST-U2]